MGRAEQIATERRRRNSDALSGARRRLTVNEENLDREKYSYRFANDEGARIHQLTVNDDWEVVTDRNGEIRSDTASEGAQVSVHAGTGDKGEALRTVLLRKPKSYHDEDVAASQRRIDETEAGLRDVPSGSDGKTTYVPKDGISLSRG